LDAFRLGENLRGVQNAAEQKRVSPSSTPPLISQRLRTDGFPYSAFNEAFLDIWQFDASDPARISSPIGLPGSPERKHASYSSASSHRL
jgi:hypothetical protein